MTILQQRLIDLRTEKGITQKDLAKKINVSGSAIGYWETGINEPKATYLLRLSEFFEVSADYLLGLEDDFGSRTVTPMGEAYSSEERKLIEAYRELNPAGKKLINQTIETLHESSAQSEQKKSKFNR